MFCLKDKHTFFPEDLMIIINKFKFKCINDIDLGASENLLCPRPKKHLDTPLIQRQRYYKIC